jgi:hypothetical protein
MPTAFNDRCVLHREHCAFVSMAVEAVDACSVNTSDSSVISCVLRFHLMCPYFSSRVRARRICVRSVDATSARSFLDTRQDFPGYARYETISYIVLSECLILPSRVTVSGVLENNREKSLCARNWARSESAGVKLTPAAGVSLTPTLN